MIFCSFLGSVIFLIILGIIICLIFYKIKWKRQAFLFALALTGEFILSSIIKEIYQRPRPPAFFNYELPASYSFPSGHAFGSFCFYGLLAWLITTHWRSLPARISLWLTASTIIFLIGFSRIYLGVHYPSDVIAGYLAAFLWSLLIVIGDFFHFQSTSNIDPAN